MLLSYFSLIASSLLATQALSSTNQQPLHPIGGIDDQDYTVLTHKGHPHHKLRLRRHEDGTIPTTFSSDKPSVAKYCHGATSGYTGYLSTLNDTKHFYFAYFTSRSNDPSSDPLMMWLNGGPGCSSMAGLFMELGPCRVNDFGNSTTKNPYSWIEAANVFFLDQPIGVGFSYDSSPDYDGHSNGTFAASEDIYAFMSIWYATFPESRKVGFHIAGESYAGKYIPITASHMVTANEMAIHQGRAEDVIPLESVMIGNGIFDQRHQDSSYWDIPCTNVTGIGPILSKSTCQEMSKHIPTCESLWKACYNDPNPVICRGAEQYCGLHLEMPFAKTGLNYYDISKKCEGNLCYPIVSVMSKYLNDKKLQEAFGVDKAVKQFQMCSNKVFGDYNRIGDGWVPTTTFTTDLLNKGVKVLIYVGSYDWICNFVGNERFLLELPWYGQYGYRHAALYGQQEWSGGQWWQFENLRYVRVQGAGHMVPYDKPEGALAMVKAWLAGKDLE